MQAIRVVENKMEVGKSPQRVLNTSFNFTLKYPRKACEQGTDRINFDVAGVGSLSRG